MATGYTSDVTTGGVTDLRTFTLRCARAFGACVDQRDEAIGALPRRTEVPSYFRERLAAAERRLAEVMAMTATDAYREAVASYGRVLREKALAVLRAQEARARCEEMLAKVKAWTIPTADHAELKAFMVAQLTETIRWDGNSVWGDSETTTPGTEEEELRRLRASARAELRSARADMKREMRLAEERNAWISALYASLDNVDEQVGTEEARS